MSKINHFDYRNYKPVIQMAPLIDIVFLTLVFFMTMSVYTQMESELSISVPKAVEAKDSMRAPGEIIINITKSGDVIVNQQELSQIALEQMLGKVSTLFPNQPVIIRADEDVTHKHVIKVLDACAKSDIWNISFATTQ